MLKLPPRFALRSFFVPLLLGIFLVTVAARAAAWQPQAAAVGSSAC